MRLQWFIAQLYRKQIELNLEDIETMVLNLGNWLVKQKYIGNDVKTTNPPREISTVYSFSLIGWINLYNLYKEKIFIERAEYCLNKLLKLQQPDGSWLFPYEFRGNPAYHPYSCENFMTVKSLIKYYKSVEQRKEIAKSIKKNLDFLINRIGYKGGVFWYSPTDKIKVPNISSMAANIFAQAYPIFGEETYLQYAHAFADYCVNNQMADGAFPYFEGETTVYIPYHALEIWELKEANTILRSENVEKSIQKAVTYMKSYLQKYSYSSYNIQRPLSYTYIIFKTPLWIAKAFLKTGDYISALEHFSNAVYLFKVPNRPYFFYYLKALILQRKIIPLLPVFSSVFMRYNASCFEIGSELLRMLKE